MTSKESIGKKYDDLYAPQPSGDEEELITGDLDKQSLIQSGKKHPSIETVPLRDASFAQETICGFDGLKVIIVSAIVFALAITIGLVITIIIGDPQVKPHGAVSASCQRCSQIGRDIMQKKGGSAVDSALATLICSGVVNGHTSGLGGGGFMLIRESKEGDDTMALDFREMAPMASTSDMFAGRPDAAIKGGLAVGVPGELKGIKKAHEMYGQVSWTDLFAPSIQLANDGFQVTGSLAQYVAKIPLADMPARMQEIYAPNGVKVTMGQTIRRPKLAKLLETLANDGIDPFYIGAVADEIIEAVNSTGILSKSDLSAYAVRTPSSIFTILGDQNLDYKISSLPAPSGGPFVLSAINIVEGYNVTVADRQSALYYHRLAETFKFATAMGSWLGDPLFNAEVQNITTEMLSKQRAAHIRSRITDDQTHNASYYFENDASIQQSQGTTHISVIDNNNNMVAISSSINSPFGSLVMTESGIILNNVMDDFNWEGKSSEPIGTSETNYIQPGKRPQSHMAPVIAWNISNVCARKMAIGGTDGTRIWTGVTQVILHLLGFKDTLANSIQPLIRIHHPLIPNHIEAEKQISGTIVKELEDKGHVVIMAEEGLSSVNVVMKENDKLLAYADNRTIGAGTSQF